ncbi:MAG: DUF1573 domain-containing protein [Firmicutes bacterium]|nr:DUF1573 domain-containing protein [Bacillota bacterium]
MKDGEIVGEFQEAVEGVLIRHRSILDCLSKFHESTSRANRAIIKTVTNCGCISINAIKQQFPEKDSLKDCSKYMDSQIKGELCDHCREVIAEEFGNHFFYLAALCSLLDYKLEDIINLEQERINTLGHFLLS